MRVSLLFCLAGAATSLVLSPRRLAVPGAMPTQREVRAALEARSVAYKPPDKDETWSPDELAEYYDLPGCRAWCRVEKRSGRYAWGDVSVIVPWNDKKALTLATAQEEFRARALVEDPEQGAGQNSAAARNAGPTYKPDSKASAVKSTKRLRELEIEAEEKKWSGTAQERLDTATFGSALVPRRSAYVADWKHWEGQYPTGPGVPGFEPSFFYARKHSAMYRALERETDKGMTADDWVLDLYRGADLEPTINRGETAQACQCLSIVGLITDDEIGQLVIEHGFGWPLFRNGEVVKIDGAAAHAQANAWYNFCEDNQLDLWAKQVYRKEGGFGAIKGDAKYAHERCGRSKWDKTCFADLIVLDEGTAGSVWRPDGLPRLDTRPLDEDNFQLAKIQKGAADEAGRFTVTTLCYIERLGRNAVVHLPATRFGLLPLKRLTEEERIETVGRLREFAENRNNHPTRLAELARGVMVRPRDVNRKRGRGSGENYGIIVTKDSPSKVAGKLWRNIAPAAPSFRVRRARLDAML